MAWFHLTCWGLMAMVGSSATLERVRGAKQEQSLPAAIDDTDSAVRRRGLSMIAARLQAARQAGQTPPPNEHALCAKVPSFFKDPSSGVRGEAVSAILECDLATGPQRGQGAGLRASSERDLIGLYRGESDPDVRMRIVRALSFTSSPRGTSSEGDRLITHALADPNEGVIAEATRSIRTRGIRDSLRNVAALLSHSSHVVRMSAAQTLAAFGPEAREYLPQLQQAAAAERHEITYKTLESAIALVAGRRD